MASWERFWEDVAFLKSELEQARSIPDHLWEQKRVHHTDLVLSAAEGICFPALRLKLLEQVKVPHLISWDLTCGRARQARLQPGLEHDACWRIYRFLPEVTDREIVVGVQRLMGEYYLDAGLFSEAWGPLEDVLQAELEAGDEEYTLSCRILLVRCMVGQGDFRAAQEELEEAKALGRLLLEQL